MVLDNIEWIPSQRKKIQNIHNDRTNVSEDRELLKKNPHFRQAYKHFFLENAEELHFFALRRRQPLQTHITGKQKQFSLVYKKVTQIADDKRQTRSSQS
jgi:hypothetical protein